MPAVNPLLKVVHFRGREIEWHAYAVCPRHHGKACPTCREFERRLIRTLQMADQALYYIKTHGYAALEGPSM